MAGNETCAAHACGREVWAGYGKTPVVQTARLDLVAADATFTEAEIEGPARLSTLLHARVGSGWPPPDLAEVLPLFLGMLCDDPGLCGWLHWYGVFREPEPVLAASGGFRDGPDESGMVEIGYSMEPAFRGMGIASEMVRGIAGWAFAQRIEAETAIDNTGSLGVLRRCGFHECGPGGEAGNARYVLVPGDMETVCR